MRSLKILVTYGGTRVPIDNVRSITNFSKGGTGARIADDFEAEYDGHEVTVFRSVNTKASTLQRDFTFDTYEDYRNGLEKLVKENQYDVIILAAAVSDYTFDHVDGKISSDQETMQLTLKRTEKVISFIKDWAPKTFLVGFKLTSGATPGELIEIMQKSFTKNRCDAIIGNDINDIKSGRDVVFFMDHPDNVTIIKRTEIANEITNITSIWY